MTIISRILYKTIVSKSEKKVYFDRSRKTGMTMSYLVTKVFIEFDSSCGYSKILRFKDSKLVNFWSEEFCFDMTSEFLVGILVSIDITESIMC